MTDFETKISSIVEVEGKTLSPDPKRVVVDEARKQAEQAKTFHSLSTSESTPGSDTARLEDDKARRQTEQAKTSHSLSTSESTSSSDTARLEADKARRQAEAAKSFFDEVNPEKTLNQDTAHTKVNKGKDRAEESSETASSESFKIFIDKLEEFVENAHENEDQNDESDRMEIEQSEAPKPDDLRQQIYEKVTSYLKKLMKNLKNAEATSELNKLNKQIKKQNLKDKLSKKDLENFLIQILTFAVNFELAKDYRESVAKNSADDIAREKINNINNILDQLNERHEYLRTWLIHLVPRSDTDEADFAVAESFRAAESFEATESSGTAEPKVVDQAGQTFIKDGVKIKVSVEILDESDGLTSLGKVVIVRKAGFESRVIVNRETDVNPYFEIHSEVDFEKGVAKEWLKDGTYESEDLPKNAKANQMQIHERVKVKKTGSKRINKIARTQSEIQYYLIKVLNTDYISIRSTLSEMKELSSVKLKRIDAQLNRQNEQLLAELDQCREKNEHSDIEKQLTNDDIEKMPWLSPDAIFETKEKKKKEEDEDVGNIVPQRTGLKRSPKPKIASRTPKASWISKYFIVRAL